jgi:hypothetical protein
MGRRLPGDDVVVPDARSSGVHAYENIIIPWDRARDLLERQYARRPISRCTIARIGTLLEHHAAGMMGHFEVVR